MKFKLYDYKGIKYQDDLQSVVVINQDGETAILDNHTPIILTVSPTGFLRLTQNNNVLYVALEQAVIKVLNNEVYVLASFAEISKTMEDAKKCYEKAKEERLNETKKEAVELSNLEKELRENIKKIKAGDL